MKVGDKEEDGRMLNTEADRKKGRTKGKIKG